MVRDNDEKLVLFLHPDMACSYNGIKAVYLIRWLLCVG